MSLDKGRYPFRRGRVQRWWLCLWFIFNRLCSLYWYIRRPLYITTPAVVEVINLFVLQSAYLLFMIYMADCLYYVTLVSIIHICLRTYNRTLVDALSLGAKVNKVYIEILPRWIVYIIPQHGTLTTSQVELTLYLFYSPWGKGVQIDRSVLCFDMPPLENASVNKGPLFLFMFVVHWICQNTSIVWFCRER